MGPSSSWTTSTARGRRPAPGPTPRCRREHRRVTSGPRGSRRGPALPVAGGRLADLLDDISAELEATGHPDHRAVAGDGPEATENRAVLATQASLARSAARALRSEAGELGRAHPVGRKDAHPAGDRAGRGFRPEAGEVPVADLDRLARQALAVAGSVVWAELAVATADGSVLAVTAGDLPLATVEALRAGPRAEVLRTGYGLTVEDDHADRWTGLRSPAARGFLVLPLGVWGTLGLAAAEAGAFDEAVRAVAREVAAHGAGLLRSHGTGAGSGTAGRARALVITASTLLAHRLGLDVADGVDALLERAAAAGATVLDSARHVVDELAPAAVDAPPRPPEPATLRRAVAYLEEHAAGEIDVADVAAAAGLGVRGLQTTFRRWRGVTPLGHLRGIRLDRAHDDLRAADSRTTTVAEIAHRWHFSNPGRFSVSYRERYGCSPGETLRS